MRRFGFLGFAVLVAASLGLAAFKPQSGAQLNAASLKDMLTQLGYEVKDLNTEAGKEKYQVDFKTADLNVPIGFEISPSTNYIWLTINLGKAPDASAPKCFELLKQNAKIQPSFFYVTNSGSLMMAQAIDNRDVQNSFMKSRAEFISDNVQKTKEVWQG